MSALTLTGGEQTMSSREIAELTGKRHDNVRADIEKMARELSLTFQEKSEPSEGGRPSKVYLLPKRETLILVSGYNLTMRARIIDRWQELEAQQRPDPIATLSDPAALRGLLLTYSEKVIALEQANAELAPKAEALDRIATAEGSINITEAAKALQMPPKRLFTWLHAHGWIYRRPGGRRWLGYQSRVAAGVLEHKVSTIQQSDGTEKIVEQVMVTARGLTRLAKKLGKSPDTPGLFDRAA